MKEEFKWRKHVCKRNVKGSPKTKHWSNDYPEFWPRQEGWKSKQKQCDRKEQVTVKLFALQSNCVGDGAIYSRVPNCCEQKEGGWQNRNRSRWSDCQTDSRYSKAADEAYVYQRRNFGTEKEFRNRWAENFPDENAYHRRQGYLPKRVTKMNEVPATFESSVVK